MTEVVLKNKTPNEPKLLAFGFEKQGNQYIYRCDMMNGQMSLTVVISYGCKVFAEVTDKRTDEEYILHRVPDAAGKFVGQVRSEYETILNEISAKCFDFEAFVHEQTKEIIAYVRNQYGSELEFLWQKFPDNAVVRRCDNQKWYAAILTVSRRKLGFDSDERVEILDLRMKPEEIGKTVDNTRYFPGYHMNKRHWITICLDRTVSSEEIFAKIDDSFALAQK